MRYFSCTSEQQLLTMRFSLVQEAIALLNEANDPAPSEF